MLLRFDPSSGQQFAVREACPVLTPQNSNKIHKCDIVHTCGANRCFVLAFWTNSHSEKLGVAGVPEFEGKKNNTKKVRG